MKEFIIENGSEVITLNLPTKLSEITADYLLKVTEDLSVAPYYAVIAAIYRAKLPEIITSAKKSRGLATSIVPVFVKANVDVPLEDSIKHMFDEIKCNDKIIITGADVERGLLLTCPKNFITIDNLVRIYNECVNDKTTKESKFVKNVIMDQHYYYFVDIKLVSINDIKGYYHNEVNKDYVNPFLTSTVVNPGN